jgi:LPXTG-motif cell wall-anchored protein
VLLCFFVSFVRAQSDYTVIIVNASTAECKVLEGFDTEMDAYVPSGWDIISLDEEMCAEALLRLKERDFEGNIKGYVGLLNCSKETTVRSLSYFGRGAEDICEVAGYDFKTSRLVILPAPPNDEKKEGSLWYYIIGIAIVVLIFLILIKKKKHKNPVTGHL